MYSKNKSGPKIDPKGTRAVTDNQQDLAPSMTTCCFLPVNYDPTHFNKAPLIAPNIGLMFAQLSGRWANINKTMGLTALSSIAILSDSDMSHG